jgi:hypothetical protein
VISTTSVAGLAQHKRQRLTFGTAADRRGRIGPLSLEELKNTLATLPNASDVLVWARHLPDWKRVRDVPELMTPLPPPLNLDEAVREALQQRETPSPTESVRSQTPPPLPPTRPRLTTFQKVVGIFVLSSWAIMFLKWSGLGSLANESCHSDSPSSSLA